MHDELRDARPATQDDSCCGEDDRVRASPIDDTKRPWSRLSKERVHENPYYALSHDRYRLPNGDVGDYYYIDIPGSTMVVPVAADGRLILCRQYRYLIRRFSCEFPAGGLKPGVDPLQNAQQELLEEVGYRAADWQPIGEFAPYNGVSNELCQVYVARQLESGTSRPEPTEEIEIVTRTVEQVRAEIADGTIWDGMSVVAFALFQHWCKAGT